MAITIRLHSETSYATYEVDWLFRSSLVMLKEIGSLRRLRSLIFSLGIVLFGFSLIGFLAMDIYLYSVVAKERLDILQRTKGFRINVIRACMSIRNMYAMAGASDPTADSVILQARADLLSSSQSLSTINTKNYVSSPSARLLDFLVEMSTVKQIAMPGTGGFVVRNTSLWDLGNQFILASAFTSQIVVKELKDLNISVETLSVNKRAAIFM
jgi:hypothetical protein